MHIYYYIIQISGGTVMNVDTDKKKEKCEKDHVWKLVTWNCL